MKVDKQARAVGALAALLLAAACESQGPRPTYAQVDRGADSDQDGAADSDDPCKDAPEDGLPPKANDGCPADDPDNDGIMAGDDQCPDGKEDGQPPSAADGCPMTDTDQDGVSDAVDKCADKAEDNEAPNPNDGCPAPDSDSDGISDGKDKCPSQPETVNEYRDQDGCPDQEPATVVWDNESSSVFVPSAKRFQFAHDSAALPASGDATIDEIAKVMNEHPEIQRMEIEGHASTKGADGYNVVLTDKRARNIGLGLMKKGVAEGRLVPVGYGEYCPVVQTADEIDEPKNRRVLLKTVLVKGVWRDVPRGCWKAQTKGINPAKRPAGVRQSSGPAVQPVKGL